MSTNKKLQAVVMRAWWDLERAVQGQQAFYEAFEAACEEERGHRRMGRRFVASIYALSVEDTARYFVVKRFAEYPGPPRDYRQCVGLLKSSIWAWAVREVATTLGNVPNFSDEFYAIDYARDIVRSKV